MDMHVHICIIWGIYVVIHVREGSALFWKSSNTLRWLLLSCTPKNKLLGIIDNGTHTPAHIIYDGFTSRLLAFMYFMHISSATVFFFSYMICMSLGNKDYTIVIVIYFIVLMQCCSKDVDEGIHLIALIHVLDTAHGIHLKISVKWPPLSMPFVKALTKAVISLLFLKCINLDILYSCPASSIIPRPGHSPVCGHTEPCNYHIEVETKWPLFCRRHF